MHEERRLLLGALPGRHERDARPLPGFAGLPSGGRSLRRRRKLLLGQVHGAQGWTVRVRAWQGLPPDWRSLQQGSRVLRHGKGSLSRGSDGDPALSGSTGAGRFLPRRRRRLRRVRTMLRGGPLSPRWRWFAGVPRPLRAAGGGVQWRRGLLRRHLRRTARAASLRGGRRRAGRPELQRRRGGLRSDGRCVLRQRGLRDRSRGRARLRRGRTFVNRCSRPRDRRAESPAEMDAQTSASSGYASIPISVVSRPRISSRSDTRRPIVFLINVHTSSDPPKENTATERTAAS